jgi:hypothetical protein
MAANEIPIAQYGCQLLAESKLHSLDELLAFLKEKRKVLLESQAA